MLGDAAMCRFVGQGDRALVAFLFNAEVLIRTVVDAHDFFSCLHRRIYGKLHQVLHTLQHL